MSKRPNSHNGMIKVLTRDYYTTEGCQMLSKSLVYICYKDRLVLVNLDNWELAW